MAGYTLEPTIKDTSVNDLKSLFFLCSTICWVKSSVIDGRASSSFLGAAFMFILLISGPVIFHPCLSLLRPFGALNTVTISSSPP